MIQGVTSAQWELGITSRPIILKLHCVHVHQRYTHATFSMDFNDRLITCVSVLQILLYYLWLCQKHLKQLILGSYTGYTWSYPLAIILRR